MELLQVSTRQTKSGKRRKMVDSLWRVQKKEKSGGEQRSSDESRTQNAVEAQAGTEEIVTPLSQFASLDEDGRIVLSPSDKVLLVGDP
jgi:hypothetical protein